METADIDAALRLAFLGPPKRHRRTMARAFTGRGRRFAVSSTPDGETRSSRAAYELRLAHERLAEGFRNASIRDVVLQFNSPGGPFHGMEIALKPLLSFRAS